MRRISSTSPNSIRLTGTRIRGAENRHKGIAGFDQEAYNKAHVLCIGAGGLIRNIVPILCRKGIGALTILDDDTVEVSNLNRQRFYQRDIGKNKSLALAKNLPVGMHILNSSHRLSIATPGRNRAATCI